MRTPDASPQPCPTVRDTQPSGPAGLDLATLRATALALERAARAGTPQALLRGKHLVLVCEDDSSNADLFHAAATALGAAVARIRPSAAGLLRPAEVQATAQWLGRLYDAIECQGLADDLVAQIRNAAGVPVFDSVACAAHASAVLALPIGHTAGDSADAARRYVLQAMLVNLVG